MTHPQADIVSRDEELEEPEPLSSGGGRKREHGHRDDDDDNAGDYLSDRDLEAPLPQDQQLVTKLKSLKGNSLKSLVDSCNTELHLQGYCSLHQNRATEFKGYYYCGCGDKTCSKTIIDRESLGKKKSKMWSISSIGKRKCEPGTALSTALKKTFIPSLVKVFLIQAFDNGVSPKDAHNLAVTFASENHLDTTWEKSDIKNLFDVLKRNYSGVIVEVLDDLSNAGHFVKIDLKVNGSGQKYLNRFFVAFKSMRRLFVIWGEHVATLDSTYG